MGVPVPIAPLTRSKLCTEDLDVLDLLKTPEEVRPTDPWEKKEPRTESPYDMPCMLYQKYAQEEFSSFYFMVPRDSPLQETQPSTSGLNGALQLMNADALTLAKTILHF